MMRKYSVLTMILLTVCMTCRLPLHAANPDSLLLRSYRFVKRSDVWLSSNNGAALTHMSNDNISMAELSFFYGHGGLVDYHQSPSTVNLTANTESFFRINKRTVVYGAMSYDNYSGKDMTGSAFIDPSRKPFDIVEDSLTNPGDKHRDTYHLTGAVGVDIWRGFALGIYADYTAANAAKYKDLRYKNQAMDMVFSVGAYVPLGNRVELGAGYVYRRTTESLSFKTYGKTEKVYKSLVSYGPFMGQVEQFGNYGFTDQSRSLPLVDDYNGMMIQFAVRPLESLSFYNHFSYAYRHGSYGQKSPYTVIYTGHHSRCYQYRGAITLSRPSARHSLDVELSVENLTNHLNVYREKKNERGANYYEYFTSVKSGNRLWMEGQACYTLDLGVQKELPQWTIQTGIGWYHRRQTAYLYPYYRRQRIGNRDFFAHVERNVMTRKGVFTFHLNGRLRKGIGAIADDGVIASPSEKQEFPPTMDAFLYRQYQYLATSGYGIGGSCQYAMLWPGKKIKTHIRLDVQHQKSNETFDYSQGSDHTAISLTVGCVF